MRNFSVYLYKTSPFPEAVTLSNASTVAKAMGNGAPNIAPSRDELEPCSCNISPLLPSPLNATDLTLPSSFLSSFRLTDQKRLVDSIEDKVWIRSRSTRIEFTSRGEKSDKSYSNNSKVVWIAADPWRELSSPPSSSWERIEEPVDLNFPSARTGC